MKKRLLSFALAMLLGISLAACGGNKGAEGAPSNNSASETDTKSDIVSEDNSEKESGVQPISVIAGDYSETIWDGEVFGKEMAKYSYFSMVLSEEDRDKYPKLAESLEKNAKTEADAAKEGMEYLSKTYDEYFENVDVTERRESAVYMEQSFEGTVLRADSNVVSALISFYDYQGGAHGMYGLYGENYDSKTGELLNFSDVVTDEDRFFEIVDEKLKSDDEYRNIYNELKSMNEYRKSFSSEDHPFAIDNEGVVIIFNPYTLGYYALGMQVVKVFFDEAPEIFNEKYMEVCDSYVIPMVREIFHVNTIDVDGEGERFLVTVDYEEDADYPDEFESFSVNLGNRSVKIDEFGFKDNFESYIVKTGGKYYFLGFFKGMGDWTSSTIVDLSAMKEVEKEYRPGEYATGHLAYESYDYYYDESDPERNRYNDTERRYAFTNPDKIMFSPDFEIFGNTRTGITTFAMDSSTGELRMIGDYIDIPSDNFALKTLREVSCDSVDEKGDVKKNGSIPAGVYLCMVRTDGGSWADFQIVDEGLIDIDQEWEHYPLKELYKYNPQKETMRVYLESTDDYLHYIDGVREDEVFGGILYAG